MKISVELPGQQRRGASLICIKIDLDAVVWEKRRGSEKKNKTWGRYLWIRYANLSYDSGLFDIHFCFMIPSAVRNGYACPHTCEAVLRF